jgi:hypothetical protein
MRKLKIKKSKDSLAEDLSDFIVKMKLRKIKVIQNSNPGFEAWVSKELAKLKVPKQARVDFLRGCLIYAIKASQRSADPKWSAFAAASEGVAIQYLGARLAMEGPRDIAALGFWPAGH